MVGFKFFIVAAGTVRVNVGRVRRGDLKRHILTQFGPQVHTFDKDIVSVVGISRGTCMTTVAA